MWGSDGIAREIVGLGFEFAAINPGASYRGLHDSFVNFPDGQIRLILCLHDEHAVALAHGWAKVTEQPALAIVHSNVGAMHAVMPIYNAWVDRAPVVVINASGPRDATRRRPWIDWIHTAQDQAALVRPFTKWDDQPGSAHAAIDSVAEARQLAATDPKGPTFVCLDVADQEDPFRDQPRRRPLSLPHPPAPDADAVARLARRLSDAGRLVMLAGRVSRRPDDWRRRIELAERLGAAVITDIKTAAAFPAHHRQAVGAPGFSLDPAQREALACADAVLALDWIDLDAALAYAPETAFVAAASLDPLAARGWVKNTYRQPRVDSLFAVPADALVAALLPALESTAARPPWRPLDIAPKAVAAPSLSGLTAYRDMALGLERIRGEMPVAVTRYPLGWPGMLAAFDHPLDYIGRDGGEGLASGPGLLVGAALALKGSGRLAVAIIGDGDFMMGASALWTAAKERLPLLVVVAANGVYGNDVVHQERIAKDRDRSTENKWIAQRIDGPRIDIAGIARAQGIEHAVRVGPEMAAEAMLAAARYAKDVGPALVEIEMIAQ